MTNFLAIPRFKKLIINDSAVNSTANILTNQVDHLLFFKFNAVPLAKF